MSTPRRITSHGGWSPQSDTPRTDAVRYGPSAGSFFAAIDHAETLERELAVVRADLAKWKDRVTDIRTATEATVEGLRAENEKLKQSLGNVDTTHDTAEQQIAAHRHAHSVVESELAAARERIAALEEDGKGLEWTTGTPDVAEGGREIFWCSTITDQGKVFHRHLVFLNRYVMPLCDSQDDPGEDAVPVGDDGDYAWSGWYEESCEQCETQWKVLDEVKAWMRLPKLTMKTHNEN